MTVSKTKLGNLRRILNNLGQVDDDIQVELSDLNEREAQELHYDLMEIADRLESEIDRAQAELDSTAN